MQLPTIRGVIDRRILANYRIDPKLVAKILPQPFRPQLVDGFSIAGICLIRLKQLRPLGLPAMFGVSSENAAHRFAVEWDGPNGTLTGVYVPRRDSSSRLNSLFGGRLFPGIHHHAKFDINEDEQNFSVAMNMNHSANSSKERLLVKAVVTDQLTDSVFSSIDQVSDFFKNGSLGYSPAKANSCFDGMKLRTDIWTVEPLAVEHMQSSFFENTDMFPKGSVQFDNALLMRGIHHEWHSVNQLTVESCR